MLHCKCCSAVQQCKSAIILYVYLYISSNLDLPPLPIPPFQFITESRDYQAGLPLLYSNFLLTIYFMHGSVYMSVYMSVYTSVLLSQFIPPLPSPFCVHKSILNQVHQYHFSRFYIYVLIQNSYFLFLTHFTVFKKLQVHPSYYS